MIDSKTIKKKFTILLLIISPIIIYISVAFLLTLFPSKNLIIEPKSQKIYIIYNKFHSDIVFNIEEISDSWIKNLPILSKREKGYIAFGWGDKETYLNTPTWNEMKLSTSLKALFLNTPSLMHISYYSHIENFEGVKEVRLSKEQKNQLKKQILKGFTSHKKSYRGYGRNDCFYNSPYLYNFIFTCNTWVGETLRNANISVSIWTPFSLNIIHSLP